MPQDPIAVRQTVTSPPTGRSRIRWWGPGLLWSMSAVGSGSVLFTPMVGSRYGYEFLWLLWGVCALMWVMITEAGRFTVVTGRTLLDGFSTLPGPRNWALWVIFLPQLWAAMVGVAGLSALVGSALRMVLPGGLLLWSLVFLGLSTLLVVSGGYRWISRIAQLFACLLVAAVAVAAIGNAPDPAEFARGLVPTVDGDTDLPFLLPWVGTILAGSMGIIWYSYWAATRGYGGTTAGLARGEHDEDEADDDHQLDPDERQRRLHAWLGTLGRTAAIGVVVGTVIITAFLVLGSELLRPEGVMPSGADVAQQLTRLLSETWGAFGYWLMLITIVITLGGSVLANQDGWGRSLADITLLLPLEGSEDCGDERVDPPPPRWLHLLTVWKPVGMCRRQALKCGFVVLVTGLASAMLILLIRNPVQIMSYSGIVAALHTPFIIALILMLNRQLPADLRPNRVMVGAMLLSCLFYTAVGAGYVMDMIGWLPGG